MKLVSYRAPGGDQQYGEVLDGRVVAFDDGSTVKDRLASGDRAPASGPDHALDDVELLAPHVPRAIFGIGLNYLAHAQEQNAELPERPIVFMKLPTSVAAPGAPVRPPRSSSAWTTRASSPSSWARAARSRASRWPTTSPRATSSAPSASGRARRASTAPARSARGSPPPTRWPSPRTSRCARGSTASCGRTRARATSSSAIPEIVAFISETITLEPGDLILTGTPSGVGMYFDPPRFLGSGDVVRIEIEGLGVIEHAVA